ncbi:hypothetical protein FRZ67_11410 [Panacibacter ginsenosidivorans]|uniref:Uncharacterized protein n=1 Tax=Panacibacter ginsenosidivorans TaxID=1813871 RepID=A0A5B8VB24_9BACT|nr:hypothetical protein [Panacibacter ginsenosidivorans]QEC67876.1 hypothetical protein FRZ67_11410 [Panacibacter ginsenosidivorans]
MDDIYILSVTLLIALFVSLYYYKRLQPRWLRLFPFTMLLWVLVQVTGYWYWVITGNSNHFIFNLYLVPQYAFYFFIFYKAFINKKFKRVTLALAAFFLLFFCYQVLLKNSFYNYSTVTDNTGQLLVLLLCFLYMTELLMQETLINYFKLPLFWIVTGIMIFCVGNFVYTSFLDYILNNNLDPNGNVYIIITAVVTNLQYALFAAGFLCNEPWKKTRSY